MWGENSWWASFSQDVNNMDGFGKLLFVKLLLGGGVEEHAR